MTVRGLSDLSQAKLNREEYNRLSKAFLTKRDVIDSYLVGGHDLPASAEVAKQLWTKIDVLQSLGQVVGSVDTFAELPGTLTDAYNLWNIKAITTNDFAIVIVDENHEGASSRYSLIVDDHDIIT